jgi:hypothetical protein
VQRAGLTLFLAGGEYKQWIAYGSDSVSVQGIQWSAHDPGLAWLDIQAANSTVVFRGSDGEGKQHYRRWNGSDFVTVQQPDGYDQGAQFLRGEPVFNNLTIGRQSGDPLYMLSLSSLTGALEELLLIPGDAPAEVVRPYIALKMNDGRLLMTGYKPQGAMSGGAVGHRQFLTSEDGQNWTLLLSQFASWTGVGAYDWDIHAYGPEQRLYLTRSLVVGGTRIEYGRRDLAGLFLND